MSKKKVNVVSEKQNKIFSNLSSKYTMLLNSFLICLKINTTINFHFIQKIFHLNDNIRNEPNKPENNFINKNVNNIKTVNLISKNESSNKNKRCLQTSLGPILWSAG